MTAYLDRDAFANLSTVPVEFIDELHAIAPLWFDTQFAAQSRKIDGKLRKRYAAPFAEPVPETVKAWLADIMAYRTYVRRGVDPTDLQMVSVKEAHNAAWKEIDEAADAADGHWDLPLRADTDESGISKTSTLAYSEQSPFVAFDGQVDVGRNEDANRGGTYT
jgi:hypothetical protein